MARNKPKTAAETFPDGTEFTRVATQVPGSHFAMLDALAKQRGVTRAAVAASAIVEYVQHHYFLPEMRKKGEAAITAHDIEYNLGMRSDPPPDPIAIEIEVLRPPEFDVDKSSDE